MNCSNCSEPALYKDAPASVSAAYYCERHLPTELIEAGHAGLLPLDEAPVSSKSKKSAPADPAPVEEAPAEEAPAE